VGGETTGQRAAIIFTLVECARRHGHDPELYLTDILERLPTMTNQDDLGALLPSRWKPATAAGATINVATINVATINVAAINVAATVPVEPAPAA